MTAIASADISVFDNFRLDRRSGVLLRRNDQGVFVPVALGGRALDLLSVLVEHPGDVISRDKIMSAVWPGTVVEDGNLSVQISSLRRVLDHCRSEDSLIQTVSGRGYRFVGHVTRPEPNSQPDPRALAPPATAPSETAEVPQPVSPRPARKFSRSVVSLVMALCLAGLAFLTLNHHWFGSAALPPHLSIVVLPFANLSNDPDQEYFADGVADNLTTDLSRISGSFVISRSTAFTYKGKPVNVRQVGRDLGVRYVLEGSVRRAGNQVHVNVQLIDAASEAHVWADQFDADRENLAEAQSVITGRLANILNIALVRDAGRRIAEEKSIDPDAQDLVMRGRDWSTRPLSAETLHDAQQSFAQALQIDPRSIDAKLGIAGILITKYINGFSDSPKQDLASAEKLLHEVLDRDSDRANAHANMGVVLRLRGQLTQSKSELETALQLNPNLTAAHRQLGFTLFFLGQPAVAIVEGEDALRRSPRDPFLWGVYQLLGFCRLYLGQFEQAVDFLVKSRDANAHNMSTHLYLAAGLAMKGNLDAGKAALQEALKLDPQANSIEFFRQHSPCSASPECGAAREQTLFAGLRRLGFPEK